MQLSPALLLASILMHGSSVAAPEEIRVDRASLHAEATLPDGRSSMLSVEIAPPSKVSGQTPFPYGGDSSTYHPRRVIQLLTISIAGHSVAIPAAVYTDLGDPSLSLPSFTRDGKNLVLTIYGGGNGWSSYHADILIRGTAIIERRVTNNQKATVFKNYKPDVKTFK